MQAENQKLRKEIAEKANRIQLMEKEFEESSRDCKKLTDITSLYSTMLGIYIEPIGSRDKEFMITIFDKRDKSKKVFEAKIETISIIRDRPEWQVILNKLPLNPFLGFNAGSKLVYQESNIGNFFDMVKEAAIIA